MCTLEFLHLCWKLALPLPPSTSLRNPGLHQQHIKHAYNTHMHTHTHTQTHIKHTHNAHMHTHTHTHTHTQCKQVKVLRCPTELCFPHAYTHTHTHTHSVSR